MPVRSLLFVFLGFAVAFASPALAGSARPDGQHTDAIGVLHAKKANSRKATRASAEAGDAADGNNGELRSYQVYHPGFFDALFGDYKQQLLPQTRALDARLERKEERKPFAIKPDLQPREVQFSGYAVGTIVIDSSTESLYLVQTAKKAIRYRIAVGREGLQFKGKAVVGDKQEWPRWIPTKDMQKRNPKEFGKYKDGMAGGPSNPLGARAIYIYQDGRDTHVRIHGTNEPWTVGHPVSNGCFRMFNEQVMQLYRHVHVGTPVVVL